MDTRKNFFPNVMRSVTLISAVGTAALTLLYGVFSLDWLLTAAISVGTTFYHFAMRLAVGYTVPLFTKRISFDRLWFRPRKWEPALYQRLNVRNWKGRLPTYDPGQFDLSRNSLSQVICNTCQAEVVHEVIMVCSFVPLLFAIPFGTFSVFLITSVIAALYDSIFVIAQRYNRPRLIRILKKKEAHSP